MRVILDTHIALWVFAGDARIAPIETLLLSQETDVFVSVASSWELAIKIGLGKIDANLKEFRQAIHDSGFYELPVKGSHTESLLSLPPLHKDPFDRMLVAQAISEPMRLITVDEKLPPYNPLVWHLNAF